MKLVSGKSHREIVGEWDRLARVRSEHIESGRDITYSQFLMPEVLKLSRPHKNKIVLDVGCGIGVLSREIAKQAKLVIAIDPSDESIAVANEQNKLSNLSFVCASLEGYAQTTTEKFDVVIANMTMACVLELHPFVALVGRVLKHVGVFVFSLPHPCFWPIYHGYANQPDFRYDREIIVEAPFRISNDRTNTLVSTHVHRPLSMYLEVLTATGLMLEHLSEPYPQAKLEAQYPAPWPAPRYIFGSCRNILYASRAG